MADYIGGPGWYTIEQTFSREKYCPKCGSRSEGTQFCEVCGHEFKFRVKDM